MGGAGTTGGASVGAGGAATGGKATNAGGALTGGANPGGGSPAGGNATGGNANTGGAPAGGNATGGSPAGGAATGGSNAGTGGKTTTGAGGTSTVVGTGGKSTTGGAATGGSGTKASGGSATGGAATGGAATGGATSNGNYTGPCDIYAAASPATPCVAAYAMTRLLNSKYTGPLYQVRKGGNALGTGGTTQDILATANGIADGASQDTFCSGATCTVSILYDQSGKGNNLKVAPAGCYSGTASEPDYESSATKKSTTLGGQKVYALYMIAHDGYRNNSASGMPTGTASQGIYEIADGTRVGPACCWDFGNASTNNCYGPTGSMNALYFGTGYWGSGTGSGPWFLADLEAGVWAGGTGASNVKNNNLPSSNVPFAFGILKTSASNYAIRVGNAQSGALTTAYDGGIPMTSWSMHGGIILGIGGDNSNSSFGTFFEGAVTAGRPADATDALVLQNVQAAKYGQ